jgi:hypothetical protein
MLADATVCGVIWFWPEADDEAQRAYRERKIDGSSQDNGRLFARLLRDFLALPPGFGKPDGDCLLSALHRFAASAALEGTLLAFMHRLLDLCRNTA